MFILTGLGFFIPIEVFIWSIFLLLGAIEQIIIEMYK